MAHFVFRTLGRFGIEARKPHSIEEDEDTSDEI
jgi:hypothetical protein